MVFKNRSFQNRFIFERATPKTGESYLLRVLYCLDVNEENKKTVLGELEREFKSRKKSESAKELEAAMIQVRDGLISLKPGKILTETEYFNLARRFANVFKAGSGAEAIRKILENIDLKKKLLERKLKLKILKMPAGSVICFIVLN